MLYKQICCVINNIKKLKHDKHTNTIVDGKIAVTWRNADDLGRVFQLGGEVRMPV